MQLSRRTFLALSATIVAGCSGTDGGTADTGAGSSAPPATSDGTTTLPPATTPAPTAPPATDPPATAPAPTEPPVVLDASPFTLGVASGDPDDTSVVLWTRLTGPLPADGIDVEWAVVDAGGQPLASGVTRTDDGLGGTVHVVAELPGPGEFVFRAGGFESPVGRTSPIATTTELRVAAASCQHYETGFYAAHRDIADWAPDLVVFLGDFIYENAARPLGGDVVRVHEGPEPTDLDGYRQRYGTYLSDSQLQAARAACPWLVTWDDHEVENNYAGLVSQEGEEITSFAARRDLAYRAWWEHTPTRLAPPVGGGADYPIYRGVDVGDLVRISILDGRQYRSDQVCDVTLDVGPPCAGADDPQRTMLGPDQEAWIAERFASSTALWNCLAQQTVLTDLRLADTGAILNYDQWDGYDPARQRLLAGAPPDLVTLTGDIHLAGVGRLTRGEESVGVEFVTTAISSTANVDPSLQPVVESLANIVDADLIGRGYTRHTVTPDRWTAEYRTVDDIADPDSPVSTWRSFTVERGTMTAVADA